MAYTPQHHELLKPLLQIDSFNLTQAKLLAKIYNESEGANLGSPTCIDCVMKMKQTLQIRFNEHELWLDMMRRLNAAIPIPKELSPYEKAKKEVEDYRDGI